MTTAHNTGLTYEFQIQDRLRASRSQSGLTVREFETQSGISRATITNYENGKFGIKGRPNRAILIAWALATGFDLHWLETGDAPTHHDGGDGGVTSRNARTDVWRGADSLLIAA